MRLDAKSTRKNYIEEFAAKIEDLKAGIILVYWLFQQYLCCLIFYFGVMFGHSNNIYVIKKILLNVLDLQNTYDYLLTRKYPT
jgi:hypothetical protein